MKIKYETLADLIANRGRTAEIVRTCDDSMARRVKKQARKIKSRRMTCGHEINLIIQKRRTTSQSVDQRHNQSRRRSLPDATAS